MAYEQYSDQAYTGGVESAKNRISSNSNSPDAETIGFPNTFDLFVNKENASLGGFAVTEEHATADIDGSVLFLDHRPAVDVTGGIGLITVSEGTIDSGQTDVGAKTVTFSTLPTAETFTISYDAAADRVEDSHINALQNAVMALQSTVGLKAAVSEIGSGISTLPIVTTLDLGSLAELQAVQDFLPNVVLANALAENFVLGSTDIAALPGDGARIYIGATGSLNRDDVYIDANSLHIGAREGDGTENCIMHIGLHTGDRVHITGCTDIASQVTIGFEGGACGNLQDTIPQSDLGAFYSGAFLRVHGGVYFGDGISGVGDIVFVTTTGEEVQVQGDFHATTLLVDATSTFNGVSTFNKDVRILSPGFLLTNQDIVMSDTPGGAPTTIDSLDASYAKVNLENQHVIRGSVISSVRSPLTTPEATPYTQGAKVHPVHGFNMYPIIGGWTYTGLVNFEKATDGSQHQNILLLSAAMDAIGNNYPNGTAAQNSNVGGGSISYGDYATGFFNPGDTYIELDLGNGVVSKVSYPIYHHTEEGFDGTTMTGLNVYVAADDSSFQDAAIAGSVYKLFQPGNAPTDHLNTDFSDSSNPLAVLGNQNNSDYPQENVSLLTERGFDGGNRAQSNHPVLKSLGAGSTVSVNMANALTKSIDNPPYYPQTGIAYIYANTDNNALTREDNIALRASPSPYGIAGQFVNHLGYTLRPGQHCPVGEVVATTTDGSAWTLVESVGYRPDAFYDSCWVPMVEYMSALSPETTIPSNIGRCLPIFGTNSTEFEDDEFNFFVEHNIGPVRSLTEVTKQVFIASYKDMAFTGHPVEGEHASIYKHSAAGSYNLWSPYAEPFKAGHDFDTPDADLITTKQGYLRDISNLVHFRMFDSRFAMLGIEDSEATVFEDKDGRSAQYIRVVIKRAR